MIAKITKGASFSGLLRYLLRPDKGADVLLAEGVCAASARTAVEDFTTQARQNPRLSKPVGHIALAFSAHDAPNEALMLEVAKNYLNAMGIANTQVLLVVHRDQPHPHLHAVYNRCDNAGRTISDQNDRVRSAKICRRLTERYGLYLAPNKEQVCRRRLREPEWTKYALYDLLCAHVPQARSWADLADRIGRSGASIDLRRNANGTPYGVCFSMNGLYFHGSKIDRRFSYIRIARSFTIQAKTQTIGSLAQRPQRHRFATSDGLQRDWARLAAAISRSTYEKQPEDEPEEQKRYEHTY